MRTSTGYVCRVCSGNARAATHSVREMMFGTGESFAYDECGFCGSLQIAEVPSPEVLSRYYPDTYYAYAELKDDSLKFRLKRWAAVQRDRAVFGASLGGKFLALLKPSPPPLPMLRSAAIGADQRVLDVGCGAGLLLNRLKNVGFANLAGADPFLPSDTVSSAGVPLYKRSLRDLRGDYDLIMFNHSFEHVPSPEQELLDAVRQLAANGRCLIRIPTPSSEAWRTYGIHWAQLDAPRHLTLISRDGMALLAARCGLRVEAAIDDSMGWALMASELYRRGIPLREQRYREHFKRSQIRSYERAAAAANARGRGDAAAFILARTHPV